MADALLDLLLQLDRKAKPQEAVKLARDWLTEQRAKTEANFLKNSNAAQALASLSASMDQVIEALYTAAQKAIPGDGLSVLAVGGYGRSELFPYSDIDLLFLHEEKDKAATKQAEWMLYVLWDLGLTVGQAVRTIEDTMAQSAKDASITTALLDARLICGNSKLAKEFFKVRDKQIAKSNALDFVEAKLKERDARHTRVGDSRYVLEPNIKEGKGGLRDLQMLEWLTRYIYRIGSLNELVKLNVLLPAEYKGFMQAREFLWHVRLRLHYIAKRAEERLTFDMQRAIAEATGYRDDGHGRAVERFMKHYFRTAREIGNLTRSVCAVLEESNKRKPRLTLGERLQGQEQLEGFDLDGERLSVKDENAFKENPQLMIDLFRVAHEREIDIHPRTLQLVTRNLALVDGKLRKDAKANETFMKILLAKRNPEPTLRKMSEAGVLGRFIPDFGRVTGQMQFDMYHVFTVDEHTIFAIGILHGVMSGKFKEEMPIVTEIIHRVESKRVLFLSLLAHDIAKGRGGDHSTLGEEVVRRLAKRFGFTDHEIESCAWLVRQHLLMSHTAFKRDVNDPKTIEDFVAQVQSPERLRLLLILTVCDIRAVGPNVWNGWKGALLRELYKRAEEKMGATPSDQQRIEQAQFKHDLRALLPDWDEAQVQNYLEQGGPSFWLACEPAQHARIARVWRHMHHGKQTLVIDTQSNQFHAITELMLCTADQQGLFSKLAGALAIAGANILSAKIFTLKDGTAVDIFQLQDVGGKAFDKPDKLARLSVYLRKAVEGELDLAKEIAATKLPYPSRMEAFKVAPRVFIENKLSATHTVVEVAGRDRIGFLYWVTRAMAELGLTIATAHISTYGARAVDVFYVKDAFGFKVEHESKIKQLHDRLIELLSGTDKMKQAG